MQIRVFPENSIHVTAARAPQIKSQSAQVSGSVFGAQCRVTISKEGRRLSEQSNKQTARSAESIKAEKTMMRQQEKSEQLDKESDELIDKYTELLKTINKTVKSLNNSNMSKPDEKTLEKKVQLLHEMSEQKQKQLEANQNQANYAQEMAMLSSKAQDEIDENNRDLFIMLKSIEESEKAEEEQENGGKVEEDGSNDAKTENSVSDAIQNSATRFTVSSMKREMDVVGAIHALNEEGYDYISRANEIERNAFDETKSIKNLLADENYTNDEKKDAVFRYGAKLVGAYKSPISDKPDPDVIKDLEILVGDGYSDAEKEEALSRYRARMRDADLGKYRNRGVQMIKDSKEGKLIHISDNPLQGMEETKDSMIQSAVDAAFNQATQGKLDETSEELEDAVKELIDERNDIDHVDADKKEEDEEQKEIGELLQPEEEEQEQIQE
ncbi:MAG: hypothetical protein K2N89_04890 [Lachnospiraceae bacterium]|nr:hypothetical protein [Lachnospiraceae bacterium]